MMLPTHIIGALFLSIPIIAFYPDLIRVVFIGSVFGGVAPDLDLIIGQHRKSFHHPYIFSLGLFTAISLLVAFPESTILVGFLAFMIGCVSHIVGDLMGSGLEHKPWDQTSTRCVYNHVRQEWIPPSYILGYDGSLRDMGVLLVLSGVVYIFYHQMMYIEQAVLVLLSIGMVYTIVRRTLPKVETTLYHRHWVFKWIIDTFFHGDEITRSF